MAQQPRFTFDGGAGTFLGAALLGYLVTLVTLGICYPFAVVLIERWRAEHCAIDGYRLRFTGTAAGLFGRWITWFLLSVVTLGIYLVRPRLEQWRWEHIEFAPNPAGRVAVGTAPAGGYPR